MPLIFRNLSCRMLLIGILLSGCSGYQGSVAKMHNALLTGNKLQALELTNELLDVKETSEIPEELTGDNSLLLLERAMLKQSLFKYQSSCEDFGLSDKNLELLDLQNDTLGNIGKFIFSDDSTKYQAPAYEKLLLNTFNMLGYLSQGNLESARVESRRFRVMQEYLADEESEQAALLDFGSYLAGFAFEASGRTEHALSFYADAVENRNYGSLAEPIRRLASCATVNDERIEAFIESHGGPLPQCTPPLDGRGTLLVVSGLGLVPRKNAVRIPIGLAVSMAGALLVPMTKTQLNKLVARGLVTWINFPEMKTPPAVFSSTKILVDGEEVPSEMGSDISEKVVAAWDSIKPKLIAAAVVRMVTRLAAGVATEVAVSKASGSALGGLLAGMAVQGTLAAFDTPDTRSWTTLPAQVHLARLELPAGEHEVKVVFSGKGSETVTKTVSVPRGGFAVVSASAMR